MSDAWRSRSSRSRIRKIGFGLAGMLAAVLITAAPAAAQELTPAEYNTALLASLWRAMNSPLTMFPAPLKRRRSFRHCAAGCC